MKVLLIKTSALGDIVQALPVVSYLKKRDPAVEIDWVLEKSHADLVQAHPDVDHILTIETKLWRQHLFEKPTWSTMADFRKDLQQKKYDVLFDLQGNIKSGLITCLARANDKVGFGRKSVAEWPNLLTTHQKFDPLPGKNIRTDYLDLVRNYFKDESKAEEQKIELKISSEQRAKINQVIQHKHLIGRPRIMVCPGSAWKNKQLTAETLKIFLKKLQKQLNCAFLLIWGSEAEKSLVHDLHAEHPFDSLIVERLTLPGLQNLMAEMDLIVAVDSLPLHLAGTTGVATFSIFGASSAQKYKPLGKQHHALQGMCPYNRQFEKRCPILRTCATGACIRELDAESIFRSFLNKSEINDVRK